jgi:hypothetical protein
MQKGRPSIIRLSKLAVEKVAGRPLQFEGAGNLVSVPEAAKALGVSTQAVYAAAKRGSFGKVRIITNVSGA